MTKTIYVVDAFTNKPFSGNPAGVCILDSPVEDKWMQSIAAEMNLSETAFLYPTEKGYLLRWFTPTAEVDLCGHATLASAFVLFTMHHVSKETVLQFETKSGLLQATKTGEWIELDFPAEPVIAETTYKRELEEALGVQALYIGKNRMDYLVEIASEEDVHALQPDFAKLTQIPSRGVIVTARSHSEQFDFISRCFFPRIGIPEDPVTGSAHCALVPYWASKLERSTFTAYQASKRCGTLQLAQAGERVKLRGQAVIVMRNEVLV